MREKGRRESKKTRYNFLKGSPEYANSDAGEPHILMTVYNAEQARQPEIRTCSAKHEVGISESNTPKVKPSVSHAAVLLLLPAHWKHAKPNNWQHNASKQTSSSKINASNQARSKASSASSNAHRTAGSKTPVKHTANTLQGRQASSKRQCKRHNSALTAKQPSKQ